MIFKLAAFGAFIMLGYLGLRGYGSSIDKLVLNRCVEDIFEITLNVRECFPNGDYADLDYNLALASGVFPKRMVKGGRGEVVNPFNGGVDIFYSSLNENAPTKAFELSFQGVNRRVCKELIRINLTGDSHNLIAVAGFAQPMPSGTLDAIYYETKQVDIKESNIFKGDVAHFVSDERLDKACGCGREDICSVIWKFR